MSACRASLLLSCTRPRPSLLHLPPTTARLSTLPTPTPTLTTATTTDLHEALNHLRIQNAFYAKVHVGDKAYIVTRGDLIHLPVSLKGVAVGDVLALTNVSTFGSRDYTLRATPPEKGPAAYRSVGRSERAFVAPDLVRCTASVIEHTKQPMVTTIKKKRRNRHAKAVKRKQPYTVLRIRDLELVSQGTGQAASA